MIYLLHEDASKETLRLKGDEFKYIIKARRHKIDDEIALRNSENIAMLYMYKIVDIASRDASLELLSFEENKVEPKKALHVGWCLIDFNSIDKVLAQLNEMGLSKITFISCERSQKSFKVDYKRIERVLKSSNMQCGRTDTMSFDTMNSIEEFIQEYPETTVLDFSDEVLSKEEDITTVLIGCEGGFSKKEKELLSSSNVRRLNSSFVLRSESAVCAVVAKILL